MTNPTALFGAALADDPATDARVIEQVLKGDKERFEVLMRRYNQRLFRVARSILREDAEAEDAVQQSYLAAYMSLGQLSDPERFGGWMTRITVREALRRRGRRPGLFLVDGMLDQAPELAPPGPEERIAGLQLRAALESAIDSLPEAYRTVVVMRDVQELSTRETAEALAVSEESVRVRLHRARRALQAAVEERTDVALGEVFGFAGERCDRIAARVLAAIRDMTP
ncbi:MAG: RNA polymerase sigma factor [Sandaracinaceae bacterium]|nr:RNA polymerase sigma factor [Sandaracinaceae bacterium]